MRYLRRLSRQQSTMDDRQSATIPHHQVPAASTNEAPQALDWELALTASGIRSHKRQDGATWTLFVDEPQLQQARSVLEAYERENRLPAAPPVIPLDYGSTYGGIVLAAALVAFHVYLSQHDHDQTWFWRGNASAERILRGEVWRTVTALTLHADAVHVANNALFSALFASALFRALGPGVGLWLFLLAGAGGNALDALWRGPPNIAVGASTAIFGAVGGLGGLRFLNRYRIAASRRRAWVALAATLGLLAMLGAAPGTDILAHLFGGVVGVGLGIVAAIRLQRPPGVPAQMSLVVAALGGVVLCWIAAFRL
ncbi:MAG: rhomboid family intramembrane serine protease [Deltaproteobacteria bacterium]|nr:rhomboid family intramembrane serine protease [Deltaproteobacteria bacterium]